MSRIIAIIKVSVWQELGHQVNVIRSSAEKVFSEMGASISYKVGTMIEIPRAALVADEVYYANIELPCGRSCW